MSECPPIRGHEYDVDTVPPALGGCAGAGGGALRRITGRTSSLPGAAPVGHVQKHRPPPPPHPPPDPPPLPTPKTPAPPPRPRAAITAPVPAATPTARVAIEQPRPVVECGTLPAKATVGIPLTISASIFADGHDLVMGWVRHGRPGRGGDTDDRWQELPMRALGDDRFSAVLPPPHIRRAS